MICSRQDLTTILVGSEEVPFHVYTSKLNEQSPSFAHISKKEDKVHVERPRAIILLDVDVQIMDIVVNWLYTQQLSKVEPKPSIQVKAQKDEDSEDSEDVGEAEDAEGDIEMKGRGAEPVQCEEVVDTRNQTPASSLSTRSTPSSTRGRLGSRVSRRCMSVGCAVRASGSL